MFNDSNRESVNISSANSKVDSLRLVSSDRGQAECVSQNKSEEEVTEPIKILNEASCEGDHQNTKQMIQKKIRAKIHRNTSQRTNLIFVASISLPYLIIFITGTIVLICQTPSVVYQDCSEVQKHKENNGLYPITIASVTKFVQCKDGATLIQARNPQGGKQAYFFDRSKEEYEKGFGKTTKEFWIGLDMMQKLNHLGNDILRVEGMTHDGRNVTVEFDGFQMVKKLTPYSLVNDKKNPPNFTRHLSYPIISIRQSHSSHEGIYYFIRPNDVYEDHGSYTSEWEKVRHLENLLDHGFVSTENDLDRYCSLKHHSSWWYPIQEGIKGQAACIFDATLDTNLNGVYSDDEGKNGIGIFVCKESTLPCFSRSPNNTYRMNGDGKVLKLKRVQLFLKRSEGTIIFHKNLN